MLPGCPRVLDAVAQGGALVTVYICNIAHIAAAVLVSQKHQVQQECRVGVTVQHHLGGGKPHLGDSTHGTVLGMRWK